MPASLKVTSRTFGRWLASQRGDRSLEQIAIKLRALLKPTGLAIDQSLVYKIEHGRVPSWPLLFAFARVYNVEMGELLTRLVGTLEFPGADSLRLPQLSDPIPPADGVQLSSYFTPQQEGGGSYDAASSRVLADELRAITQAFIRSIDQLTGSQQIPPPPQAARAHRPGPPRRVRRARKLG